MKKLKNLLVMASLVASSNLFAHGMMENTYPSDGAMMMERTDRVELHFKSPMKLINLKVIDSSGKPLSIEFERSSEASSQYSTMMPELKPDNYTVHWKAMGEDGHMMDGQFGFMQH
ncbi:Copper resistance protein CopC [Marinobacterium sp. xm-d-420]|jgi:methionine-rich copper-binding protein CopC|uniref:copper resistance CopC family protein n=1 Tax=Marinobacterium sp. xm-d-420 TaxID=2497737 RepID=UPI001568F53F|nr:copper resistance protein CopC [Marinobacterium sp. xm-d-420]NRP27343.1 Copper resistance protein CopC [Marinobacterium sp. xm-d-420]